MLIIEIIVRHRGTIRYRASSIRALDGYRVNLAREHCGCTASEIMQRSKQDAAATSHFTYVCDSDKVIYAARRSTAIFPVRVSSVSSGLLARATVPAACVARKASCAEFSPSLFPTERHP